MWDLTKTLRAIAGARKREAQGLPPFHLTDEERKRSDAVHADIRERLAARDAADKAIPPK